MCVCMKTSGTCVWRPLVHVCVYEDLWYMCMEASGACVCV